MTAVNVTPARRRGLAALVLAAADRRPAHRSNSTLVSMRCVYWQTADWLVAEGYASLSDPARGDLTITAKGRRLARDRGIRAEAS